jgi:predicted transcriptional regulator
MEVEITSGTVEIDTDEIRYAIEDDILSQVNDYVEMDDIRYAIEDDILNQVTDHIDYDEVAANIDFFYRTHELDFDEIRENVEDDILSNVDEHLDYDEIMSRVNDEMFEENEARFSDLKGVISAYDIHIKEQHDLIMELMRELDLLQMEVKMSVWSRIVRYVRSWF